MSIKRWFRNWLMDDNLMVGRAAKMSSELRVDSGSDDTAFENFRDMIRFNVQPARGGIIVTVKHYDTKRDDHTQTVHVIQDDQNVAENISHIVSMEILRSN